MTGPARVRPVLPASFYKPSLLGTAALLTHALCLFAIPATLLFWVAGSGLDSGSVVVHADTRLVLRGIEHPLDTDEWPHTRGLTRLDSVSQQIAERLPQQHIVCIDMSELAGDDNLATQLLHIVLQIVGGTLDQRGEVVSGQ